MKKRKRIRGTYENKRGMIKKRGDIFVNDLKKGTIFVILSLKNYGFL